MPSALPTASLPAKRAAYDSAGFLRESQYCALGICEAALAERRVTIERAPDPRDLDRVDADGYGHVLTRMPAMPGESIRVTRTVVLPLSDVEFRTSRSSGPGGQHAQKTETRVEAVLDVERRNRADGRAEAARRRARRAGSACGGAGRAQSVAEPRARATERLVAQLREALRVPRKRRPTKPTQAAVERRLDEKRRRSRVKRLRGTTDD